MPYFSPWVGMLKIYCHICNQHSPICLIAKFPAKIRILQLGKKMLYLGVSGSNYHICNLGVEMLRLGAKNNVSLNLGPKTPSYLKSTTPNLSNCKTL